MAQLVNSGSGNFTSAASWNVVDTTSFLNSEAGTTNSPTTFTNSSQFTPGAITVDGIGLKISTRNPTTTATLSVRLVTGGGIAGTTTGTAVAGTTVTVNVSDLAQNTFGWYFFKFSSPVTLVAATAYNVQVTTTNASHVVFYRDATASNWSRFLRTTTTQAPVAADTLIVIGDMLSAGSSTTQTVTMDNTAATAFGQIEIGGKGVLSYDTATGTTYQLRINGNVDLGAGTLQIGTPSTPIPATSSASLEIIVASNVQFGIRVRGDATFTSYGAVKTGRAYLASDAAAAATTLTSDVSTGWLSGDRVVIASTTRTPTETEQVTLSANASGTTLSSSALGFAHSGTNPTRAELANLTRNIKIFGQSTTLQTFILIGNTFHNVSLNYTEFFFMGSGTTSSRGIDINTVNGSFSMSGCAIRNFEATNSIGINVVTTACANISVTDTVFYRCALNAINTAQTTATTNSFTNCWGFANVTASTNIFAPNMNAGTFSSMTAVGAPGTGNGMVFAGNDFNPGNGNFSNLVSHSNGGAGVLLSGINSIEPSRITFSNLTTWRNASRGVTVTNCYGTAINGLTAFGNTTSGIVLLGSTLCADILLKNMTLNAGTVLTQPVGLEINGASVSSFIEDSTFGSSTTHATGDISVAAARSYAQIYFRNCLFSSPTSAANLTNLLVDSFIGSMSHNQVSGASLAWTKNGVITKDTAIFDTTSPGSASTRLAPSSASIKLKTPDKQVICLSGKSVTISAKIRWSSTIFGDSANYNGNPTRLWLKKNPAVGINSDVLLATLTTSPNNPFGNFVRVTATTPSVTDNGVLRFYIDCDGTTGWINVDTWSCEIV